jgi:hypothetical protein
MSSLFYVRLDDQRDMRRTLLETSKASIHCLRAYQDLVRVRGQKVAEIERARQDLRELTVLLNRLEKLLPALSEAELGALRPTAPVEKLPELPAKAPVVAKGKASKKAAKKSATKKLSTQDELPTGLADRLAHIERTLGRL